MCRVALSAPHHQGSAELLRTPYRRSSQKSLQKLSEKGFAQRSEDGFGQYKEGEMGRKVPSRRFVGLGYRRVRGFSDSFQANF
jgi:hypothetical protein